MSFSQPSELDMSLNVQNQCICSVVARCVWTPGVRLTFCTVGVGSKNARRIGVAQGCYINKCIKQIEYDLLTLFLICIGLPRVWAHISE